MFPEQLSMRIIELISDEIDLNRTGVAIEIGVGTNNFYSIVYKNLGFHTIAVDPIPFNPFLELASVNGIIYDESCIYINNNELVIHLSDHADLSSIHNNWWGLGKSTSKVVKSQDIKTFIKKHRIEKITFLKVDTEGSEYEILQQFYGLDNSLIPNILEFEYGGGGLRNEGIGGWDTAFFKKTIEILNLLKHLNYKEALILDSNDLEPIFFSLNNIDFETLFKPNFEYGNLIAFKDKILDKSRLNEQILLTQNTLLKDYIDNLKKEKTKLNIELLKKDYIKRISNKIKRFF